MILALVYSVAASQVPSPPASHVAVLEQITRAARRYAHEPSCSNADALLALIPDRALISDGAPGQGVVGLLYSQLTLIQAQLLLGDACAARLAFRLVHVADAAFAEDLSATLGALATTRPELFLTELARSGLPCQAINAYSSDYSDSEARHERAVRLERLRQVDVPASLQPLRSQCLRMLEASPAP